MKIRHSVASLFLVLLPLFICLLPSSSYALFVTDQLTINFVPTDPQFTSLTGGEAAFFQVVQVGDKTEINLIDDILVPNLNRGDSFTIKTYPPDPCIPVDPMFFAFEGTANTALAGFIAQAFEPGATPVDPHTPGPPAIDIGTFGNSLTPLTMSGPIFAFVSTAPTGPISPLADNTTGIQVGTWEVTVTPVPEPSTILLVIAGLLAVMSGRLMKLIESSPLKRRFKR